MTRVRKFFTAPILILVLLGIPVLAEVISGVAQDKGYTVHDLAYYLDENLANFVRPGLILKVTSATVQNNVLSVRFTITDPKGLPLDRNGVNTPGTVSTSFIAAYIPKGASQYTAYTTRIQTSPITKQSATQAGTDSGGTYTTNADGDYTYTFKTTLPSGYDASATHAVGIQATRNLTEFGIANSPLSSYANAVYNFVPNGAKVTVVRDVVRTESCNQCHNPLSLHGGSRQAVELCTLCHQPQTTDPDTGNTVDLKVMVHKIHNGKGLPSVKAGKPYQIIGYNQTVLDFSTVGFPSDVRRCATCHKDATQGANYMTKPTRDACGSCHDDLNFATGDKHAGGPQVSDNMCATCHIPQGELEFDASILGAHVVQTQSTQLPGVIATIVKIDNAAPGKSPTITFSVKDKKGNVVDITKMNSCRINVAGPTTDITTQYYEDARSKATASGGNYIYTMTAPIPAGSKGTFAFGMEGYNNVTLNPGTVLAVTARDVMFNPVAYVSVDGSPVAKRRQVVALDNCNKCHGRLFLHGGNRNNTEYCVFCHNPTKVTSASTAVPTGDSVNFKTMIHKIHTGEELQTEYRIGSYVFNEVLFPGDRRDCLKCHVNNSYNIPLPNGVISSAAPRDYINPMPPISGACLSCHTSKPAAAHASIMTSPTLGESCEACHGPTSEASIDKVHAR